MKLDWIIIISLIVLLTSCGKKAVDNNIDVEVVTINQYQATEYLNLSEIADSVKCIRLQPDSGDVMGRVREIIVKKKYIYALDVSQQVVFVFDKDGKFVSKLDKRGQGPGEYQRMGPVFIDDSEEYVELLNYIGKPTKIKYTNISFELIEVSPFPDINFNLLKRNVGNYYYATQQLDNVINGEKTNADLVIYDGENHIKTLFDKKIETNYQYFSPTTECFTTNDKGELFISLMYDNTFYRLEAGKAYPVFTVDFGEYSINNAIGLKSTKKQMEYLDETNDLASFPVLNMNDTSIMSFSYYFKNGDKKWMDSYSDTESFRQYIKIKNSNKTYHTQKIKNDITSFPDYVYISSYFSGCAHEVWYEDYLVDIVLPNHYFSNDKDTIFVDGLGEITAYDDPIVVMMKLKKE